MMFLQMNNSRGMDDSDDITVENVVVKEKSSTKDNVELVELGSSSDEEECSTSVGLFNRSQVRPQAVRVFRPIMPAWGGRSSAYFQQRIQAARLQQLWSRKRRNSNDYDVAEVSSEGRLLVNVGKPAGDPDVHIVDQLTNVLQPHQLQGVKFMYDNVIGSIAGCKQSGGEGCILAHSMGLGKTLQVITFVEVFFRYTEFKRVIIVCPVNTIQNWANEFEKWLPSSSADEDGGRQFTVHLLNDSVKGGLVGRAAFVENWHQTGGVLLISYDMFKMLTGCTAYKKKGAKPFDGVLDAMVATGSDEPTKPATDQQLSEFELKRKLLAALVHPGADMIVCDEGHQIKNMKTEKSASLNAVSTKRRIVLTGYPLQNNLQEYYCMVSFVRPGYLGSKKNFREMFEKPINAALASDAKPAAIRLCKMRTHVLQMKLAGFVQRRTQHLLKKILPDSREYVVLVRKSPIQQEIYRAFVNETNSDIYDQNASFNPLRAHTICVKVLNHPDMLYFACKERMKRESQKQPKRGDADNSNSSNSLSNNLTSNENRSEPPTSNGISLKIDGAANSALGLTTSTYGATNSGCAAIPQPTFDAIRPTTIVNAQLPTLSTSSNVSNFCVADDQRPSTSAEATAGVKCRMAKTERVTLGDALLDDDEKIDNSIKLEWAHVPLRNYKSGILENSSKMKLAFSIIDETTHRGEKILFFSSSVNTLNTFESFLCQRAICGANGQQEKWRKNVNYCRFDGRTTGVERERLINRFNGEPELLLFLISTKAGSLGINLVSANRVIIFEASWNPCDDAQAICRIYRYGQRKRTFIYRLIMNNSMEKAIFHRQIAKSTLQQKVVDHQDIDAKVSTKELETLFQYDDNVDFKPIEKNLDDWALDDDLLMKVARENTNLFADVPFLHESLMLESEEKLSEEEKYEAELLYEREMRGGYLGGWCEELEFNRYTSSAALIGRPVASGVGSNDIVPGAMMSFPSSTMSSAAAGAGGSSGLVDTNGFPRLFPPDFAFIHPDAVAFNRAFRRLGEESMMIPPQAPYTGPIQLDETLGSENQVLPNPTPYPKLLREDANASSTTLSGNDDDSATAGGSVPEKSKTLAEVLDSLMSENPSLDASSSESIAEVCSTGVSDNGVSGGIDLLSGSLQRPPSIALLRRPISVMQHPGRPYSITSDGRVVISQDIELSSIRSSGEKVKLRAGELVVLCRTVNGTYIKTGSGNLLDASNTIYATAMPRLPMSLQRRPIVGGMTASGVPPVGKKHRFAPNEVIELE